MASPPPSAHQVDRQLEQSADAPHLSQGSHPASIVPSSDLTDGLSSPGVSQMDGGDLGRQVEARRGEAFPASQLSEQAAAGGLSAGSISTAAHLADELHPPTAGGMDQSEPAEPQGGDLGLAQKQEAKRSEEERDVEEAVEALEMEDEGEDDEEGKQRALPVETLVSGAVEQPEQETPDTEEVTLQTGLVTKRAGLLLSDVCHT